MYVSKEYSKPYTKLLIYRPKLELNKNKLHD